MVGSREPEPAEPAPPRVPLLAFGLDELLLVVALIAILFAFHVRLKSHAASMGPNMETAISPDGSLLAVATIWGNGVIDLEDSRVLYRLSGVMKALEFSPDNRHLLAAQMDGVLRLINAHAGVTVQQWTDSRDPLVVRFHPDGKMVATAGRDGPIKLWSLAEDRLFGEIDPKIEVHRIAYARSGDTLVAAGRDGTPGHVVQIWDLPENRLRGTLRQRRGSLVRSVAVSADGKKVATIAGKPFTLFLWDVPTAAPSVVLKEATAGPMEFSRDGRYLLHCARDGYLAVHDLQEGSDRTLPGRAWTGSDARFIDGDRAVAISHPASTAHFWDLETGQVLREVGYVFQHPISWPMVAGFGVWIVTWFAAYHRRRRHPSRATGQPDRGVYILAFVAAVWVLTRVWLGAILNAEGFLDVSVDNTEKMILVVGLAILVLAAVIFSLLALLLWSTGRFRGRLIFILPSLAIALWTVAPTVPTYG